jgi:probable addiction module antidote protein
MSASKSFTPYRAADYLQSPEEAAEYLNAAIEDGQPAVLLKALRNVADSTGGMSHLSRETGLTRESLYKALSEDGNPRLSSLDAILRAMGLQLNVQPRSSDKHQRRARASGGPG